MFQIICPQCSKGIRIKKLYTLLSIYKKGEKSGKTVRYIVCVRAIIRNLTFNSSISTPSSKLIIYTHAHLPQIFLQMICPILFFNPKFFSTSIKKKARQKKKNFFQLLRVTVITLMVLCLGIAMNK